MDRRSREDSGLIDLDALMRQAEAQSTMTPTNPVDTAATTGKGHIEKTTKDEEVAGPPPMPPALPSVVAPLPRTSPVTPAAATAVSPSLVPSVSSPSIKAKTSEEEDSLAAVSKPPFIQMPAPMRDTSAATGNRPSNSLRFAAILGAWAILIGGGVAFMMVKRERAANEAAILAAAKTPAPPSDRTSSNVPPNAGGGAAAPTTPEGIVETATTTTSAPLPSSSSTTTTTKQPSGAGLLAALLPSAAGTTTAAPQSDPASLMTVNDATNAGAGAQNQGDLGSAMKSAVGDKAEAQGSAGESASGGSGAAQVHPSPGAVIGAIGAVMPSARACLGPDDPIRNGTITFKSDGSVARVELRGSSRETDQCVRDALSKAKVQPFNDETFSTRVTVRP